MKYKILLLILMSCFLLAGMPVHAAEPPAQDMKCGPDAVTEQDSSGVCSDPAVAVTPAVPESSFQLLLPPRSSQVTENDTRGAEDNPASQPNVLNNRIIVYFFWGKGCPHCEEEKIFLDKLKLSYPSMELRDYEVWYDRENAKMMAAMLQSHGARSSGVPVTFVRDRVFSGFKAQTGDSIEKIISECKIVPCGDPGKRLMKAERSGQDVKSRPFAAASTASLARVEAETSVNIPFLGYLDARNSSLPVLTLVIAGIDSFNPCAFFVLLSLLGLLVHAQSRSKMLLVGGIFVFFSGLIYFLFMAAWLNLFLVMGHVALITTIAGVVSVTIAGINIKDFFIFKRGISLTIPDSAKPKLFDRMRKLLRSTSLVSILIGTTVLAIVANSYELLCTAGFPMVFTRILTLSNLSPAAYYLYLVLYNIVYVVPLFIIVSGFTLTLGKRQLSEWQGRVLKLSSGSMMLGLGIVLLVNPALLNSVMVSFVILAAALGVSFLVAAVSRKLEN